MKTLVAAIVLQVLALLSSASSSPLSIDPRDVATIGGRNYYFSNIFYLNVAEATAVCQRELNMTLAGFETREEHDAVTDYMANVLGRSDHHWTSGVRQIDNWLWSNSGVQFSYYIWAENEPSITDNTVQLGMCIQAGFMRDCTPTSALRFVCEEKSSCN